MIHAQKYTNNINYKYNIKLKDFKLIWYFDVIKLNFFFHSAVIN